MCSEPESNPSVCCKGKMHSWLQAKIRFFAFARGALQTMKLLRCCNGRFYAFSQVIFWVPYLALSPVIPRSIWKNGSLFGGSRAWSTWLLNARRLIRQAYLIWIGLVSKIRCNQVLFSKHQWRHHWIYILGTVKPKIQLTLDTADRKQLGKLDLTFQGSVRRWVKEQLVSVSY